MCRVHAYSMAGFGISIALLIASGSFLLFGIPNHDWQNMILAQPPSDLQDPTLRKLLLAAHDNSINVVGLLQVLSRTSFAMASFSAFVALVGAALFGRIAYASRKVRAI
jgi:hypothetical protein